MTSLSHASASSGNATPRAAMQRGGGGGGGRVYTVGTVSSGHQTPKLHVRPSQSPLASSVHAYHRDPHSDYGSGNGEGGEDRSYILFSPPPAPKMNPYGQHAAGGGAFGAAPEEGDDYDYDDYADEGGASKTMMGGSASPILAIEEEEDDGDYQRYGRSDGRGGPSSSSYSPREGSSSRGGGGGRSPRVEAHVTVFDLSPQQQRLAVPSRSQQQRTISSNNPHYSHDSYVSPITERRRQLQDTRQHEHRLDEQSTEEAMHRNSGSREQQQQQRPRPSVSSSLPPQRLSSDNSQRQQSPLSFQRMSLDALRRAGVGQGYRDEEGDSPAALAAVLPPSRLYGSASPRPSLTHTATARHAAPNATATVSATSSAATPPRGGSGPYPPYHPSASPAARPRTAASFSPTANPNPLRRQHLLDVEATNARLFASLEQARASLEHASTSRNDKELECQELNDLVDQLQMALTSERAAAEATRLQLEVLQAEQKVNRAADAAMLKVATAAALASPIRPATATPPRSRIVSATSPPNSRRGSVTMASSSLGSVAAAGQHDGDHGHNNKTNGNETAAALARISEESRRKDALITQQAETIYQLTRERDALSSSAQMAKDRLREAEESSTRNYQNGSQWRTRYEECVVELADLKAVLAEQLSVLDRIGVHLPFDEGLVGSVKIQQRIRKMRHDSTRL